MIKPVRFTELLADKALLEEYAAECSIPAIGKIDPQAQLYYTLEWSGAFRCLAAYRDGQLVGFGTLLMTVLPHYGRKVAAVESLFVAKAHRRSTAGKELLDALESTAREAGCIGILYSAPAGERLERLLSLKKNYKRTNAVFFRSL